MNRWEYAWFSYSWDDQKKDWCTTDQSGNDVIGMVEIIGQLNTCGAASWEVITAAQVISADMRGFSYTTGYTLMLKRGRVEQHEPHGFNLGVGPPR